MYRKLIFVLLLLMLCFPVAVNANVFVTDLSFNEAPFLTIESIGQPVTQIKKDSATYTTNDILVTVNSPTYDGIGGTQIWQILNSDGVTGTTCSPTNFGVALIYNNTHFTGIGSADVRFVSYTPTQGTFKVPQILSSCPTAYYLSGSTNFGSVIWRLAGPVPAYVNFSISDSANFSQKLSGVTVTVSSGASGTTDTNGTATIAINPAGSGYTYSLTKTGYTTVNGASLGGYGETGGTLYATMTNAVITTPVPTPTLPPVPSGYVRTIVIVQHATAGSPIYGATINLRDVQNTSWKNGTTSQSAATYIDTLPSHTIDVYGSAVGYSPSQETGAAIGGTYRLPLYPTLLPPGPGNVNVAFNVYDENGLSVPGVSITLRATTTGATTVENTGSGGGVVTVLPNSTTFSITAHKSGYQQYSGSLTTPAFADSQVRITLPHDYLPYPTATTITQPTVTLIGSALKEHNRLQGQEVVQVLYDNGRSIAELAVLAMIMSLLSMVLWGLIPKG